MTREELFALIESHDERCFEEWERAAPELGLGWATMLLSPQRGPHAEDAFRDVDLVIYTWDDRGHGPPYRRGYAWSTTACRWHEIRWDVANLFWVRFTGV